MGSRRTIKMRGFMLLILLGYVASCAAITCKDGETEHSGKCYKLYTEKKNFNEAKATCKGATGGGDLISVDSAEMQQFVMIQMEKKVDEIWLGAKVNKTDWRWVKSGANLKYQGCFSDNNNNARLVNSGSSKPDNTPDSCIAECRKNNRKYAGVKRDGDNVVCRCGDQYSTDGMQSNGCEDVCPKNASQKCGKSGVLRIYSVDSAGANGWFSKQPNNYDGYQPCLALHRDNPSTGYPYKFADEKCHKDGDKYGYLCEYDSQQSGCTMHQGRCYSQHSTSLSWFKARAECMKNGGNLLQVDTQKLFEHFISDSANLDKSVQRWWIGGSNELWQWPSGNELMYQNWASNEPSSASDECAIIGQNVGKGYEWDDKSCSDQFGFMCQTGEVATTTMPTTPSTEATTPSTKATTPSTKATTPSTKATTPSTKATTPSTKATTPSTKATTPSTKTTTPSTKATTPSTKATTPSTKATAPSTKPTVPTAKPTPAKATTADTNTWEENGNVTTTATPVNPSEQKDKKKIFTTGVIVAIAVAAVFVLLAFIRVMIYCCSSSASADSKPFAE